MRRLIAALACVLILGACSGDDPLGEATSCSELSDLDVSSLSDEQAQQMGDLVLQSAQSALDASDNAEFVVCQQLVGPLDGRGVVLDLDEMDQD